MNNGQMVWGGTESVLNQLRSSFHSIRIQKKKSRQRCGSNCGYRKYKTGAINQQKSTGYWVQLRGCEMQQGLFPQSCCRTQRGSAARSCAGVWSRSSGSELYAPASVTHPEYLYVYSLLSAPPLKISYRGKREKRKNEFQIYIWNMNAIQSQLKSLPWYKEHFSELVLKIITKLNVLLMSYTANALSNRPHSSYTHRVNA